MSQEPRYYKSMSSRKLQAIQEFDLYYLTHVDSYAVECDIQQRFCCGKYHVWIFTHYIHVVYFCVHCTKTTLCNTRCDPTVFVVVVLYCCWFVDTLRHSKYWNLSVFLETQ